MLGEGGEGVCGSARKKKKREFGHVCRKVADEILPVKDFWVGYV